MLRKVPRHSVRPVDAVLDVFLLIPNRIEVLLWVRMGRTNVCSGIPVRCSIR